MQLTRTMTTVIWHTGGGRAVPAAGDNTPGRGAERGLQSRDAFNVSAMDLRCESRDIRDVRTLTLPQAVLIGGGIWALSSQTLICSQAGCGKQERLYTVIFTTLPIPVLLDFTKSLALEARVRVGVRPVRLQT